MAAPPSEANTLVAVADEALKHQEEARKMLASEIVNRYAEWHKKAYRKAR